jgi:hypothetical protein
VGLCLLLHHSNTHSPHSYLGHPVRGMNLDEAVNIAITELLQLVI